MVQFLKRYSMGFGRHVMNAADQWGTVIYWLHDTAECTHPKNVIPLNFSLALDMWQTRLRIRFQKTLIPLDNSTAYFNVVFASTEAWSADSNGRQAVGNKVANLRLKHTSSLGNALHEIGHMLGLAHEQDHPGAKDGLYGQSKTDKYVVYSPYDPASIMHYGYSTRPVPEPSPGDIATVKAINGWPQEIALPPPTDQ
jgi:hypothetical protein